VRPCLKLIRVILLHKWYVLLAGWRLRVPLRRSLVHDLSKFSPAEFGPYARHFYGKEGFGDPAKFDFAWDHHKQWNPHHWEFWACVIIDPMPMVYVREMIADWLAAGRAYNGVWPDLHNYTWYKDNKPKMHLHPDTEMRIGFVLAEAITYQWGKP